MTSIPSKNRGITLIELAVAIVIIAALLTALTAGRNILRAAKVRAVVSEVESYRGSFVRFQEKYNEMPGDMTEAVSYFGVGNTENGNGDETVPWGGALVNEGALAWQHLQLSGMVGISTMTGDNNLAVVDSNVPSSRITGAGYYIDHNALTVGNHFGLGRTDGDNINNGGALKPDDAFNIDSKIDDGIPNTGRVRGGIGSNSLRCTFIDGGITQYDIVQEGDECIMIFQLDNTLEAN